MLISDAMEEYLATKRPAITQDTYRWYCRFLGLFGEWTDQNRLRELERVTAAHVAQFVEDCPTENTHTRHARAQVVKGFLSWCAKDPTYGVREAVIKRIEMPRIVQSEIVLFDEREIDKLLRGCEKTNHPYRNKAIIHLLLDTGVRAAELCLDGERTGERTGLLLEDVVLGRDDSFIRVMGKGRKPRTISLGQETTLAVRRYLTRERLNTSEYLLNSREGDALSVRMLQQFLDELGKSAGVADVHPHRFRHTFAVNQLLAGTSDLVLMRLLGHTTLDATKIYTRAMSEVQARNAAISVVDRMRKK